MGQAQGGPLPCLSSTAQLPEVTVSRLSALHSRYSPLPRKGAPSWPPPLLSESQIQLPSQRLHVNVPTYRSIPRQLRTCSSHDLLHLSERQHIIIDWSIPFLIPLFHSLTSYNPAFSKYHQLCLQNVSQIWPLYHLISSCTNCFLWSPFTSLLSML